MIAALAVVAVGQLPAFMTGALAVQIRRDLGFSSSIFGVVIGAFFVAAALGSTPLGHLVERIGWRMGMRIGAVATFCSLVGVGLFARSWQALAALLVVGGLGNAIAQPAANMSLARMISSDRQGLVFGIKQAAIPVATLSGGLSVPLIALTVGWRWAYFAAAALAILAGVSVVPHPGGDQRSGIPPSDPQESAGGLRGGVGPLVFVSIAGGLGAMVGSALGSFLVTTATQTGFGEASAGLLLVAGSALGLSVRVGSGWAADRWSFRPLHVVAWLLGAGTLGCVLIGLEGSAALVAGTALAFGAGWGWPALMVLGVVRDYFTAPAYATGILQTGVYVGAAVGPVVFGVVADTGGFSLAWFVTAVLAAVAAGSALFGERRMASVRDLPSGMSSST